jgi:hypothetical protein
MTDVNSDISRVDDAADRPGMWAIVLAVLVVTIFLVARESHG